MHQSKTKIVLTKGAEFFLFPDVACYAHCQLCTIEILWKFMKNVCFLGRGETEGEEEGEGREGREKWMDERGGGYIRDLPCSSPCSGSVGSTQCSSPWDTQAPSPHAPSHSRSPTPAQAAVGPQRPRGSWLSRTHGEGWWVNVQPNSVHIASELHGRIQCSLTSHLHFSRSWENTAGQLAGYIREALGVAYLWALRSLCCLSQSLVPPPLSRSTARRTPWLSRPCQHTRLFPSPFCTHPRSQSHVRPIIVRVTSRQRGQYHVIISFSFIRTCMPHNYAKSTHLHVHVYNRHSTLLYAREGNTCVCGNHINDQCSVQQSAWQDSGIYVAHTIYSRGDL